MNQAIETICGVVVTYHPSAEVAGTCAALVEECGRLIVVDNGSGRETCQWLAALPGVEVISLPENCGVAQALNVAFARAADLGFAWVLACDQDSIPRSGLMAALWNSHLSKPNAAVVGPRIVEGALGGREYRWLQPHPWCRWWFQRAPCRGADLTDVSMVMTSGSLIELACWRALGGFDERLFIDYVDTDFCLRCRQHGRLVAVSAAARLDHQLGRREQRKFLGHTFYPTNHPPFRHYYIARNRVLMLRRHGLRFLHWTFFDLAAAGLWLFRVLVFEQAKATKLKAMALGTWDGLRGRSGPAPARRMAALSP
jgi:rhamnosyltransferase